MNPELKVKWVAALRSGEYRQCRERMTTGSAYCCLGVLADISNKPLESDFDISQAYDYCGRLLSEEISAKLQEMNDGFHCDAHSFSEIADWIEKNL